MATTAGSTSEVVFPQCSRGGKLLVNTSKGYYSLTPNSLGLKFFQVIGNYYNQVIGDKSRELVCLRRFDHGQRNLHSLSSLKNLRVLELHEERDPEKHLEELWETDSDGPVQLRELVICGCPNFQGFPKSIGYLKNLRKVVLSSGENKMKSLPESFCLLQSLEHLELQGCGELSSLPSSFGHLRNLRHLDLSDCNELSVLPGSFKKLILLQHLCLQGCSKLFLDSDILENMTKVEYLNLRGCNQLEEFPHHITNQASLRELDLSGTSIKEIPMNISQLSKLQKFNVGSNMLTSMPTSLGHLFSLTALTIDHCSKLKFLPDSIGHLNLFESLEIRCSRLESLPKSFRQLNNLESLKIFVCPMRNLDLGAGPLSSSSPTECQWLDLNLEPPVSLCNLKWVDLYGTHVSKISISEHCCPGLEILRLTSNSHLTEIEVLTTTIKELYILDSKMVRNISSIAYLVNIQTLCIKECPELDELPSFEQLVSLQLFVLIGCFGVKKLQGLENCRALEILRVDTRWEEAGIETFEYIDRLRWLQLTAISRSVVEACIQSLQKWPEDMIVCTQAVPESGSVIDSFAFTNLCVIDFLSNQMIQSSSSLKLPSDAILLCFVLNCNHSENEIRVKADGDDLISLKLVKGKWVLICVVTPRSRWDTTKKFQIEPPFGEIERGMVVKGEEERVVKAFHDLWKLLSN